MHHIRSAVDQDFQAIADITNHYITTSAIHFSYQPVTARELHDHWLQHRDRFPVLVAVDPHAPPPAPVIGYARAYPWRAREAYAWTAEAGIYVRHDHHARGLGKGLYSALIDELRARGFHSVIGGITVPNPVSQRLHESLGFQHVGTFGRAGYKHGSWHDVAFYQLMLAPSTHRPLGGMHEAPSA